MFLAFFQADLQLVVSPRALSLTVTYTHIIISTYILLICQYSQPKTAQLLTGAPTWNFNNPQSTLVLDSQASRFGGLRVPNSKKFPLPRNFVGFDYFSTSRCLRQLLAKD